MLLPIICYVAYYMLYVRSLKTKPTLFGRGVLDLLLEAEWNIFQCFLCLALQSYKDCHLMDLYGNSSVYSQHQAVYNSRSGCLDQSLCLRHSTEKKWGNTEQKHTRGTVVIIAENWNTATHAIDGMWKCTSMDCGVAIGIPVQLGCRPAAALAHWLQTHLAGT